MGHEKRKVHGGRPKGCSDKLLKRDLDREEGDLGKDDQLMEETQNLNQAGVLDGDLDQVRGRSAYLVAGHWDWSICAKPFTVYKLGAAAAASSSSSAKLKRLRSAGFLDTDPGGKSFISMRSIHRTWIVGVGGASGDIIIFDTKSPKSSAVIHGPNLLSAKWCPVLTAVGDKVYALAKVPSWTMDPDFPPWFEELDISKSRVVSIEGGLHLEGCSWSELPNPPCIPWKLSPTDYTRLQSTIVMSYVVVAPYILISFNQQWGTHAFDTNSHEWHKVDDNNLPFIGCASQHGPIFLALSKMEGPINAYCIRLATSDEDNALKLYTTVLPVKYNEYEVDVGPCFSSLDNAHFCSVSFWLTVRVS